MSEDSTTPHESDSHASDGGSNSEDIEVTASPVEAEPIAQAVEGSAPDGAAAKSTAAATEPSAKRVQPIPVAVEESGTKQTFDKVLKLTKETWVKVQPILVAKGTQALLVANRFTNDFLDNTGPKLANQAIAKIPDSTKAKIEEQKAKIQPTLAKIQPLWDKGVVPFWQKVVVPAWNKGLAFLRQKLPANLQELTDRFLTVLVITIAIAIYWFFSSLTSGKPAAAKQPPVPTKPVLTRPAPRPMTQRPTAQPQRSPVSTIKPTATSSPKPVAVAPVTKPSTTTAVPQPTVTPSPAIDLAEIQTQLASAVAGFGDNLVVLVKTASENQQLKVSLGTDWNSLSDTDQQSVAQKLLARSQKLQFSKFALLDSTNTLVARSPVVGSNVIMLQPPAPDRTLQRATDSD